MSLRLHVYVAALALALPAVAAAQGAAVPNGEYPAQEHYGLRLEYRDFRPTLNGEVQKSSADLVGTLIDPKRDLAIQDVDTFEGRGTVQFRRGHKLRLSFTRLNYHGDAEEVRRTFNFRNTRFERFDHVVTSMKGGYYAAAYEWDFIKGSHGYLGALLGAKAVDADWVIVDATQTRREQDTLRAPVPALGAATRFYSGRVSVEGEVSGLSIGSRGSVYEAEGSVRLHLSDRLAVMGGYRRLSIRGEDGRDHGQIILGGWQFGLEMSL
jgi:hypothetical protein